MSDYGQGLAPTETCSWVPIIPGTTRTGTGRGLGHNDRQNFTYFFAVPPDDPSKVTFRLVHQAVLGWYMVPNGTLGQPRCTAGIKPLPIAWARRATALWAQPRSLGRSGLRQLHALGAAFPEPLTGWVVQN